MNKNNTDLGHLSGRDSLPETAAVPPRQHAHTPGPWVAHNFSYGYGLCVVTNPPKNENENFLGQVIASRTTCPDWEANARLIAAAPALLSVVEAILKSSLLAEFDDGKPLISQAEAAVKLAKGGKP